MSDNNDTTPSNIGDESSNIGDRFQIGDFVREAKDDPNRICGHVIEIESVNHANTVHIVTVQLANGNRATNWATEWELVAAAGRNPAMRDSARIQIGDLVREPCPPTSPPSATGRVIAINRLTGQRDHGLDLVQVQFEPGQRRTLRRELWELVASSPAVDLADQDPAVAIGLLREEVEYGRTLLERERRESEARLAKIHESETRRAELMDVIDKARGEADMYRGQADMYRRQVEEWQNRATNTERAHKHVCHERNELEVALKRSGERCEQERSRADVWQRAAEDALAQLKQEREWRVTAEGANELMQRRINDMIQRHDAEVDHWRTEANNARLFHNGVNKGAGIADDQRVVTLAITNHRGEVRPMHLLACTAIIHHQPTEHYPTDSLKLTAWDIDRNDWRTIEIAQAQPTARKDVHNLASFDELAGTLREIQGAYPGFMWGINGEKHDLPVFFGKGVGGDEQGCLVHDHAIWLMAVAPWDGRRTSAGEPIIAWMAHAGPMTARLHDCETHMSADPVAAIQGALARYEERISRAAADITTDQAPCSADGPMHPAPTVKIVEGMTLKVSSGATSEDVAQRIVDCLRTDLNRDADQR